MNWGVIPGEHSLIALGANGRRYLVHIGHGRIWYALEYADNKMIKARSAKIFDGPEASRLARAWCEERGQR